MRRCPGEFSRGHGRLCHSSTPSMSDPQTNLPLNYAPPAVEGEKRPVYPLIWWLGASPLVMGVVITILYYFTSWSWLQAAGLATIFGGLVGVLIGGILLLSWWAQELRQKPSSRWAVHFRVVLAGMLLLSNFPAALVCMGVAKETDTRLRITIVNRGVTTLKQCAVVTRTQTKEVGPLAPGQ